MPSDASIYGMLRQPAPLAGPLDQYTQGLQVQHLIGANDLAAMQRQQVARQLQQEADTEQAYREAGGDPKKVLELLYQRGLYKPALAAEKAGLDITKTRADIGKTTAETHAMNLKALRDQLASVTNDEQLAAFRENYIKFNGPQGAALIPQSVNDPNFNSFREKAILTADQLAERLKPQFSVQDFGGTKGVVQGNPMATGGVTGLQPKTMTPGERASNAIAGANLALNQRRAAFEGIPGVAVGGGAGGAPAASGAAGGASPVPAPTPPRATGAAAVPVAAQQGVAKSPMLNDPSLSPKARQELAGKLAAEKPRDVTALEDNVASLDQAIEQAKAVLEHPGLSMATGMTSFTASVPGTRMYDAAKKLETLKGQVMLGVLSKMKSLSPTGASGFGQLSNAEGDTLRNSITNLEKAQTTDQIKEALNTVVKSMENAKDRMARGFERIYGEKADIKRYENLPTPNAAGKIAPKQVDSLPDPRQHEGWTATGADGAKYLARGGKWVRQ